MIFATAKLNAKLVSLYAPLRKVWIPILVSVKLITWSRYIRRNTDCKMKERERGEGDIYRLILIDLKSSVFHSKLSMVNRHLANSVGRII